MRKLVLICLLAVLYSCNPTNYIYRAPIIQSQVFEEKGDVFIAAGYNQLRTVNIGYAFSDNLGLLAGIHGEKLGMENFTNYNEDFSQILGTADLFKSRNGFDLGLVYFKRFQNKWQFELLSGYGRFDYKIDVTRVGDLSGTPYMEDKIINPLYNRFFAQPSFGVQNKNAGFSVGVRTQYIAYLKESNSYGDVLFEPFVQVKGGTKHVKANFHIGTMNAIRFGNAKYSPIHLGLGLQVSLNAFGKKKSTN